MEPTLVSTEAFRRERILFRFGPLSAEEVDVLVGIQPELVVRPHFKDPTRFAVSISILQEADFSWIRTAIFRLALSEESYGIFVSLVTDHESDGLSVPRHVRRLINELGGQIDFSVMIGDDVDDDDEEDDHAGPELLA